MKKRSLFTIIQWGGVLFLLALLISCPGSSDIKIHTVTFDLGYDGAPPPPEKVEIEDGAVLPSVENPVRDGYQFDGWYTSDGTLYDFKTPVTESFTLTARWTDFLEGQWTVFLDDNFQDMLIDIQHTLPEYWIFTRTTEDNVYGIPIKSNRTKTDDGWFVVSSDDFGEYDNVKIKYRFEDDERNTLEAEVSMDEAPAGNCKLVRISSEKEIKLHIVSFKLDDSASADDYVISNELIAVGADSSIGREIFPTLKNQDGTEVPALFTTANGTAFTEDTPVDGDITVTVTPALSE